MSKGFKVGDSVLLKSCPEVSMTVVGLDNEEGVLCKWRGGSRECWHDSFPVEALELVDETAHRMRNDKYVGILKSRVASLEEEIAKLREGK